MAKWQFYVSRPSDNFWNPYETVEAGVFEGTLEEAQAELSERIRRTWSPYVTHDFQAAEQSPHRTCPDCSGELQLLERCVTCQHLQAVNR